MKTPEEAAAERQAMDIALGLARRCYQCRAVKPRTTEHWSMRETRLDGITDNICRACHGARRVRRGRSMVRQVRRAA